MLWAKDNQNGKKDVDFEIPWPIEDAEAFRLLTQAVGGLWFLHRKRIICHPLHKKCESSDLGQKADEEVAWI